MQKNVKTGVTYCIIANFGNDSIALIQRAHDLGLSPVKVISVDTGWAAPRWKLRVEQAKDLVAHYDFEFVRLQASMNFAELVAQKHNFPSQKFHWCAKFLKGLTLLDYLDQIDPGLEAIVLQAKRRSQALALNKLSEYESDSELFGGRTLWFPLFKHDLNARNQLIAATGFDLLNTRSLECDPCIYSQARDMAALESQSLEQLKQLEQHIGKPMFPGESLAELPDNNLGADQRDIYFTGCGSEYSCGE